MKYLTLIPLCLAVVLFAYPAIGGKSIKKGPDLSVGGPTAPGVKGTVGNIDTLAFIQSLDAVPFPGAIDPPEPGKTWTDAYVSEGAGGTWAVGSDSNDGLSIDKAFQNLDTAFAWMVGGEYRRINLDGGDTWDVNSGYDTGFTPGDIVDGTITTGTCPLSPADTLGALEQPCYWIRSYPGTGQATINSSDNTNAYDFFSLRMQSKGANFLFENIDMVCDAPSSQGNACIDTFGVGIAVGVNINMTINDNNNTSGQVTSCHDYSITHLYGGDTFDFTGTAEAETTTMLGTQDSCALAIHTDGLMTASGGGTEYTNTINLTQGGGDSCDITNKALCASEPQLNFLTGLRVTSETADTGATNSVIKISADHLEGSDTISNDIRVYLVDTQLQNKHDDSSSNASSYGINLGFNSVDQNGGGNIELYGWHNVLMAVEHDVSNFSITIPQPSSMGSTDRVKIHWYGNIHETQRYTVQQQIFRINDVDFLDGTGGSSLDMGDLLYENTDNSNTFYANAGAGACTDNSAATLAACASDDADQITTSGADIEATQTTITCDSSATSNTTVCDYGSASPSWTTNQFDNAIAHVSAGSSDNEVRRVASNTSDTITFDTAFGAALDGQTININNFVDNMGECKDDSGLTGACLGTATAAAEKYQFVVPDRLACPAYICGMSITNWDVSDPDNDIGRVRNDRWGKRYGP